jgi:hypothetical protein
MVNWKRVQRPKSMGGLGILDLTKFNRALRLHWRWYKWNNRSKPWSDMIIDTNTVEAALFEACTSLVLGDGKSMSFWNGRWLQGNKPKAIAPAMFRPATCKNNTVAQGFEDGKWMRGLQRISTPEELDQFITLWSMITHVQLNNDPDKVIWRLSADGWYTTKYAYRAQFLGSHADYEWNCIWKSKAEPKCRFFLWLLFQNKLWTTD